MTKINDEHLNALHLTSTELMSSQLDTAEKQLARDRVILDALNELGLDPFVNTIDPDTGEVVRKAQR